LTSRAGLPHPAWSPDGTRIAFTDETLTLYWVEVASGVVSTVDRAEVEPMDVGPEAKPISDFTWSPDSRFIAYSKIGLDHVSNIYVAAVATGSISNLSSGLFNDFAPAFTRDGEHLLFVSNRHFDPTFCDFEWEMVYKDVAGIYASPCGGWAAAADAFGRGRGDRRQGSREAGGHGRTGGGAHRPRRHHRPHRGPADAPRQLPPARRRAGHSVRPGRGGGRLQPLRVSLPPRGTSRAFSFETGWTLLSAASRTMPSPPTGCTSYRTGDRIWDTNLAAARPPDRTTG
jgi:hypothetical protein